MDFYARYFGIFGGGGSTPATPFQEVPAGAINNVNTAFTLSHSPVAASLSLYLDGRIQVQGVDYNLAAAIITMVVAPTFAQELYAIYTY